MRVAPVRQLAVLLALAIVAVACGDQQQAAPPQTDSDELRVAFASFDVAVGEQRRILAGLRTDDAAIVAFGSVEFALAHIGDETVDQIAAEQVTQAEFLAVPGSEPTERASNAHPRPLRGEAGVGVYAANVALDRPGRWVLQVTATFEDGTALTGTTAFHVLESPQVPSAGDPAPRVANWTIADVAAGNVEAHAVDSRAAHDGVVPAEHLHDTVIADALDAGERLVVAVTTPVYCVSQFCGPLTEVMADLALRYENVARFVHLEVWADFDNAQLNEAAAAWIQTETGGNEPWVFLVDSDGTIVDRWDNVLNVDELVGHLEGW